MVRVKRRYIVFQVTTPTTQQLAQESIMKEFKKQVGNTYGDFGVACLNRGFVTKRYDGKDGFIVVCLRKGVEELMMSVAPLITSINKIPCRVNIVHLSGTLRAALKELKKSYIMGIRASIAKSSV